MTKFSGTIGFATQEETSPGVWKNTFVEKEFRGEILQNQNRWQPTENVNEDFVLDNKFSLILNAYLSENLGKITYLKWMGTKWRVSKIEIKHPRIIITTGSIYNESTN